MADESTFDQQTPDDARKQEMISSPVEPCDEPHEVETPFETIDLELTHLLETQQGLCSALEALLFATPEPLSISRLARTLEVPQDTVKEALKALEECYHPTRGIQIIETASGFQMATREIFGDLILRLRGRKRRTAISTATLETLAIIAYRQPIIRAEIEAIRGVESGGAIRNLIDMNLVEMVGRKEVLGRPPMYGTTEQFLHSFGLRSLKDMPPIDELKRRLETTPSIMETEKTSEKFPLSINPNEFIDSSEAADRLPSSESIQKDPIMEFHPEPFINPSEAASALPDALKTHPHSKEALHEHNSE